MHDKAVDIRLISATHNELHGLVQQQKFREDLYYRLNTVPLRVPPLREHAQDIPMLVEYFLSRMSQDCGRGEVMADRSAMDALQQYFWPGNIRELRNVLERAVLMAERNQLTAQHLQFQNPIHSGQSMRNVTGTLKQMERAYINLVLQDEGGCIERSALRLGIPRSSLYNKMKRFEILTGTGRSSSGLIGQPPESTVGGRPTRDSIAPSFSIVTASRMWALTRLQQFDKAYRTPDVAWDPADSSISLRLPEGLLVALLLVTPFWIVVGFLVHLLTA
jgi:Sigma-54 interaction domain/Bacterial regulatory protein, Fis family